MGGGFFFHILGIWTTDDYVNIGRKISKSSGIKRAILQVRHRKIGTMRGLQIADFSNIGENLSLPHGINIVININAVIGDNCTIFQGVTIGAINYGKRSGSPIIEDNVTIGPNAVIVGGITIGKCSFIAGNAFVNHDIPPYSIVIGNPAVIHKNNEKT